MIDPDINESYRLMNQLNWSDIEVHYTKQKRVESTLEWDVPPIPKLKNPNIHYLCPKCHNFPFIRFLSNKESIYKLCACYKEPKFLNIKDLFIKENEHFTFIDSNESVSSTEKNNENMDKNKGFRCTNHDSKKYNKFRYFCISCNDNLCKECCQNHIKNNHDIIILDFQNFEMYKKIKEINTEISSEEIKKEESSEIDNNSFAESINIDNINEIKEKKKTNFVITECYKFVKVDDNVQEAIPLSKLKKIDEDFIELINIIITDFIKYPNYYHFYNIENIYNIIINVQDLTKNN